MHFLLFSLACLGSDLTFDFLKATPLGSWQEREETLIDDRGRQTLSVVRSSLLAEEERNGDLHYWIEVETQSFELKKDKRKAKGDIVVLKTLVAANVLRDKPENILRNLADYAVETIIQTGEGDPMRLSGAGVLAQGMLAAFGFQIEFQFTPQGNESVNCQAGTFDCQKIQGTGSARSKVLFKEMVVESETTSWLSQKVPFGLVRSESTTKVNGEAQNSKAILTAMGLSGAISKISKTPVEMPNLFGQ